MELSKRKHIRLINYDYSQNGAYFITICTQSRAHILGDIVGQGLCSCRLSQIGSIVKSEIEDLLIRFNTIAIPKYVIMPNHIHLIIEIQRQEQSPCPTIGEIICAFKSISTKKANSLNNSHGKKIWQYRYHDHIIRSEEEYLKFWEYIDTNPLKWKDDEYFMQ